jgi:hypothetical protein
LVRDEHTHAEGRGADRDRHNDESLPASIVSDEGSTVEFTKLIRIRKTAMAFRTVLHNLEFPIGDWIEVKGANQNWGAGG